MTDNNATQPGFFAFHRRSASIRQWIKDHPNIWEFILFNVLSNISTITLFRGDVDRHRHLHQWHGPDAAVPLPGSSTTTLRATGSGRLHLPACEALAQVAIRCSSSGSCRRVATRRRPPSKSALIPLFLSLCPSRSSLSLDGLFHLFRECAQPTQAFAQLIRIAGECAVEHVADAGAGYGFDSAGNRHRRV